RGNASGRAPIERQHRRLRRYDRIQPTPADRIIERALDLLLELLERFLLGLRPRVLKVLPQVAEAEQRVLQLALDPRERELVFAAHPRIGCRARQVADL